MGARVGKGVAIAVVATALILIVILAITMNTQRHYYRGTPPGVWEIKLGTLHSTKPPVTKTIRLSDVAWLIIKGSKAEVKINLTKYKEVWLKENPGFCANAECDAFNNCRCFRYLRYLNVTFKVVSAERELRSRGRAFWVRIEVPIIQYVLVNDTKYPIIKDPREEIPTPFEKYVLAPLIKYLSASPKEEALNVKYLIEQAGYNGETLRTADQFWIQGGECGEWAGFASHLGGLLGLKAIVVSGAWTAGPHDSAFLCNETWWRNQYGLRFYLRNGTVLECYLWVDTGYIIQVWEKYSILEYIPLVGYKGVIGEISKIEKLVDGEWVKVYPYD